MPPHAQESVERRPQLAEECALQRCPRILVLMATRNGEQWIEEQVHSVLAQKGVVVELDIRDDNSSDTTRALLTKIAHDDARVRLRSDHRGTGSAAANFFELIASASVEGHDYVALCDQDDAWHEDKLQAAARQLSAYEAGGYSAAVTAVWPTGRKKLLSQATTLRSADYLFEGAGQGCTFVFPTQWFRQLQTSVARNRHLLGKLHFHDWALYALTRAAGVPWKFDPRSRMMYRQHAGNDTGARTTVSAILRRMELIRSGWYRDQIEATCNLVLAVQTDNLPARKWRSRSTERGLRGRLHRFVFILRQGRRRASDRIIQLLAVVAGHL